MPGQSRARALTAPLVVGAACAAGVLALAVRSPHEPGSWGLCPLYALTGLFCPACGVLRATHDLAHLDLVGAWSMNPAWVVAAPLLVAVWVLWLVERWRGATGAPVDAPTGAPPPVDADGAEGRRATVLRRGARSSTLPAVLGVGLVVYGVLRNVPALAGVLAP